MIHVNDEFAIGLIDAVPVLMDEVFHPDAEGARGAPLEALVPAVVTCHVQPLTVNMSPTL